MAPSQGESKSSAYSLPFDLQGGPATPYIAAAFTLAREQRKIWVGGQSDWESSVPTKRQTVVPSVVRAPGCNGDSSARIFRFFLREAATVDENRAGGLPC